MNRVKVSCILEPKKKSLIEIKFDSDELIEFKYVKELEKIIEKPESLELKCEKYETQLCKYENNIPEFLTHAEYSLKFLGDEKDLKNVMKFFQKIFPDYFVGLEKEK